MNRKFRRILTATTLFAALATPLLTATPAHAVSPDGVICCVLKQSYRGGNDRAFTLGQRFGCSFTQP